MDDIEYEPSEAESSISVDIEGTSYHERNEYGSPIHPRILQQQVAIAQENNQQQNADQVPSRVVCSCKNTCSRKRTARSAGCPCRNANQKCGDQCRCGTSKLACKNKEGDSGDVSKNPSALDAHQQELLESEREIEQFVQPLTDELKTAVLIKVLSQGRGSLDYARNLIQSIENPEVPLPRNPALTPWCICGVCRPMDCETENKCCKKARCITSYTAFHHMCIDKTTLKQNILQRADLRADPPDYSTTSYRKAAYRAFIIMKYAKLGKGNRRVIPACVVAAIRQAYQSDVNVYMGFRDS